MIRRRQGATLDYTLLYVPKAVDHARLQTPAFMTIKPFNEAWDVNPLAWLMAEKGGTLLDVRIEAGHFGKRRVRTGIVRLDDPEQRGPLLDVIRQLVMMTPNRWLLFATWFGWDDEIREIRNVGEPDDAVLAAAEDDVWYRFEGPPLYG